jgi:hypothetical protein
MKYKVTKKMHVDKRDEVSLITQQRRRQKSRCFGDLWLFVVTSFIVATCNV